MAAEDLSLTQVYCSHQLLLLPWLLTIASTFSSLFSEFGLSPYPKFSALVPSVCHDTLSLDSSLVSPDLSCPGLHLDPFHPHLPPTPSPLCVYQLVTYLCWYRNRWVREKFTHPMNGTNVPVETFLSAKITPY